jgi:hypothetical protein
MLLVERIPSLPDEVRPSGLLRSSARAGPCERLADPAESGYFLMIQRIAGVAPSNISVCVVIAADKIDGIYDYRLSPDLGTGLP